MVVVHCYLLGGVVLEDFFLSLGVVNAGGARAAVSFLLSRQGLFSFSFSFSFHQAVCILDV